MSYNSDYPRSAPPWLRLMPAPAEIPRFFPKAMQTLALQILHDGNQTIQWNEKEMTLQAGSQRLVKTLTDNNRLKTRCTCDWKRNEHCIHDYVAYHIMHEIANKEGWSYPGESPFLVKLTPKANPAAVVLPPPAVSRKTEQAPENPVAAPAPVAVQTESSSTEPMSFFSRPAGLEPIRQSATPVKAVVLPEPSRPARQTRNGSPRLSVRNLKQKDTADNAPPVQNKQLPASIPAEPDTPAASTSTLLSTLSPDGGTIPVALTVEADFHLQEKQVGLRFYTQQRKSATTRQLMLLSSVLNRSSDLHSNRKFQAYQWNDDDAAFLLFIYPELASKRKNINILRSNTLMITAEKFQEWRRKFSHCIGRFINRDDQRPLPPIGQTAPVGLAFQITDSGCDPEKQNGKSIVPPGYFRIKAQVLFPNGLRKYVWQILSEIADDPNAMVTRSELFQTDLPVKWPMLQKYFNRQLSTIRKENAPTLIPQLLCQHLELLEDGPCVKRQNNNRKDAISPCLQFSLKDNCFCIQCLAGGTPLHINSDNVQIRKDLRIDKYGHLIISVATAAPTITTALNVLRELARNPNATADATEVRFPECLNSAIFLSQAWRNIPEVLEKKADPELDGIFAANGVKPTLQPLLQMYDNTAFIHFDVEWEDAHNRHTIDRSTLYQAIAKRESVIQDETGRWLAIDPERAEIQRQALIDEGILEPDGSGSALLRRAARDAVQKLTKKNAFQTVDDQTRHFAQQLLTEPIPELPPFPEHLDKLLRGYQKQGTSFLTDRSLCHLGAILADDMGLGKTLQVLSMLSIWKTAGLSKDNTFNALIVCPATVIGVWCAQAREFCPELDIVPLTGSSTLRQKIFDDHPNSILVTHYGLVRADSLMLKQRVYEFIILDEAQNIKNPQAQATTAVKSLESRHRLALTGTPVENRLQDLWSIMDFLNPGFLGTLSDFNSKYTSGGGNIEALVKRMAPLMLRRDKHTVAAELPPRTVTVLPVEMTEGQRDQYTRELVLTRNCVNADGGAFEILAALTRLRQLCCDPELRLKERHNFGSGKLELLLDKTTDLLESGHSILVFSQFAQMLTIIQREMTSRGIPTRMITGDTPVAERAKLVDEFNGDSRNSVMLLSLKAAGTGLTLTRADYVFLYDPWWNPAAENQAIDRTHRIGQTKPVFAYRLVAEDSIEERVLELMQRKQELFDAVVGGASEQNVIEKLDRKELLRLLD